MADGGVLDDYLRRALPGVVPVAPLRALPPPVTGPTPAAVTAGLRQQQAAPGAGSILAAAVQRARARQAAARIATATTEGIPLPTQGTPATNPLAGYPVQPTRTSLEPEQVAALLRALQPAPPPPPVVLPQATGPSPQEVAARLHPPPPIAREGIGTSYGAYGQPDSAAYRTGDLPAPGTTGANLYDIRPGSPNPDMPPLPMVRPSEVDFPQREGPAGTNPVREAAETYVGGIGTAGGQFIEDPSVRGAVGVVGAVANLPGVNVPYTWNVGVIGDLGYDVATGKVRPKVVAGVEVTTDWRAQFDPGWWDEEYQDFVKDPANRDAIVEAHDKGLDIDGDGTADLTGGHAVYAAYQRHMAELEGEQGLIRGRNSLLNELWRGAWMDPLTYAAFVSAGSGGVLRALATKAGKVGGFQNLSAMEKVFYYAAQGTRTVTTVPNAAADLPFTTLAGVGRRIPGVARLGRESARAAQGEAVAGWGESLDRLGTARLREGVAEAPSTPPTGPVAGQVLPPAAALPGTPPPRDLSVPPSPSSAAPVTGPTPAERGTLGTGKYERVRVDSSKTNPQYGILDPDGNMVERVDGTYAGSRALKRRDELNRELAQKQEAGLDLPGTEIGAAGRAVGQPIGEEAIFDPETGQPLAGQGIERYQWLRNGQQGQTFGNQMELRPVPGNPEMAELYVRIEGRGDWQLVKTGARRDLRPSNDPRVAQWWRPVGSFDDPEAVAWGRNYDTYDEATHGAPPPAGLPEAGTPGPTGILRDHWLNPETGRATPYEPGRRAPSVVEAVAEDLGAIDPSAAQGFWDDVEANPKTRAFVDEMDAYDTGPERGALIAAGKRGKGLDTPDKVLATLRYDAEVLRPAYREALARRGLTDLPPPPHRFGWVDEGSEQSLATAVRQGGKKGTRYAAVEPPDLRHVLEQAVFGSDEAARGAREWLHVQAGNRAHTAAVRGMYRGYLDETRRLRALDLGEAAPPLRGAEPPAPAAALPTEPGGADVTPGGHPIRHVEDRSGVGIFEIETPKGAYQIHGPGPGRYPWHAYYMKPENFGRSEFRMAEDFTRERVIAAVDKAAGSLPAAAAPPAAALTPAPPPAGATTPVLRVPDVAGPYRQPYKAAAPPPPGALPGEAMPNPGAPPFLENLPGPATRTAAEVAGVAPTNEVARLFNAGRITAADHAFLTKPFRTGPHQVKAVYELFDENAAKYGPENAKTITLEQVKAMEFGDAATKAAIKKRGWAGVTKALDAYDAASSITREAVQFNIVTGLRGSIGDTIGDGFTLLVTGHPAAALRQLDPVGIAKTWRYVRANGEDAALLLEMGDLAPLRDADVAIPATVLPHRGRAETNVSGETLLRQKLTPGGRTSVIVLPSP